MQVASLHFTRSQERMLIQGGIILGVFFILIFFVLLPKNGEKNRLYNEVKALTSQNQFIQDNVVISHDFGEKLRDIMESLKHYRNMIPPQEVLPKILDEIGSKAQANRLKVLSLQALETKPFEPTGKEQVQLKGKQIQEVEIGLTAEGTFVNLGRYIHQLENAPYTIMVREVGLWNQKSASLVLRDEPTLKIDLKLVVLMMTSSDKVTPKSKR